jgi:transposase
MNPIEHVWDQLGKRVRRSPNPPITTEQLAQALVEEWNNFPQDALRRLVRSSKLVTTLRSTYAGKRRPH